MKKDYCYTCGVEITNDNYGDTHNLGIDCIKCYEEYVDNQLYSDSDFNYYQEIYPNEGY